MTTPEHVTCASCNRSGDPDAIAEWHTYMHPFRPKGSAAILDPPKADPKADIKPAHGFPFDPVLRQALIDKGVLTVDDLRDAEAKIVAVTGQFMDAMKKEVNDGGTANSVGWGRVRSGTPPS